jgi:hypothetical protein
MLHLGKVKVRAMTSLDEFGGIVEEVDGEVEKGARSGLSVDVNSRFVKVPSSGPAS